MLERESQPGYRSTGRSAALFAPIYGTPLVRAVTRASRAFYQAPPPGFAEYPILGPRGVMFIDNRDQQAQPDPRLAELHSMDADIRAIDAAEVCHRVPVIRPDWVLGAAVDPGSMDMDVDVLHQAYLRGVRQQGGLIIGNAEVCQLARRDGDWQVSTTGGDRYSAPVVANADPVPPHDVQAEELDVATGIHRIAEATTVDIHRPARMRAGLRSFVADGDLVAGFDTAAPGFFWIAAQGGCGIQSADAMGRLSASLMRGEDIPDDIVAQGVSATALSPRRLRP